MADVTSLIAQLQAEYAGLKAETAVKVASLEDTITGLAHENALLKRRLYGNKTERSLTSELQLALGDLLAGQEELQKQLAKQLKEATDAAPPAPENDDKPRARGRRDLALLESKLPRVVLEITEAHLDNEAVIGSDSRTRDSSGSARVDTSLCSSASRSTRSQARAPPTRSPMPPRTATYTARPRRSRT